MESRATAQYRYPYEEFADHIRAMRMVQHWQYTTHFGHVGDAQTNQASNARVLDYFSDCYTDLHEAVHKAELFLSINDYLARHRDLFARTDMLEVSDTGTLLVEPALLRAVHHLFTASAQPQSIPPKKVLSLAKAFSQIGAV